MVKVSIIVPSLNVADYIKECLDSIVGQTLKEIEVICVDAGSEDGTLEIIKDYVKYDNRIELIISDKKSYGYQINLGIKNATGQYIGIVETDDFISKEMYEELYEYAIGAEAEVVKSDHYVFYGSSSNRIVQRSNLLNEKDYDLYNKIINYSKDIRVFNADLVSWSGIYLKDFLVRNNIMHNETPGASFQDNGFWLQTMIYGNKIVYVNKAYYYLRRDNEKSSIYSITKIDCLRDEYFFMRNCIIQRGMDKSILLQYLWNRKFEALEFDIRRNLYKYRLELIKKYSDDFRFAIENQEVTSTCKHYEQILFLAYNPEKFYHKYYELNENAIELITGVNSIFIYGAKVHATKAFILINGFAPNKVKGFLVSNKSENIKYHNNLPVLGIDEVLCDNEVLIVLAVSDKYLNDIEDNLKQRNCQKYIYYKDLLFG